MGGDRFLRIETAMTCQRILQIACVFALSFGGGSHLWAHDPAGDFHRALELAHAGERSLARALLDPVLISPRIDATQRARAYHARGLFHYLDGHFVSAAQDYQRALEFDADHAAAQSALAWLHLHGLGVPLDPWRALELYERAAELGHVEAQFNLGVLLGRDGSVVADPDRALHWFEAAAETGHLEAMAQAGRLWLRRNATTTHEERARARELLRRAADADHLRAQIELGILLSTGPKSEREPEQAAHWLRHAAERGSAAAQSRLGYLHLHGLGVPEDAGLARMWFGEAARQGEVSAQLHLGWLHERGIGGDEDPGRAYTWYRRAAQRHDPTAQLNLALLYESGRGAPHDRHRARHWLERAAEGGNETARNALAWLLATARDPALRDPQRAIELASRAVAESPSAVWLDTLAAALATSGRFEDAISMQQQALATLDEEEGEEEAAAARRSAYLGRLAAYQAGRPWLDGEAASP